MKPLAATFPGNRRTKIGGKSRQSMFAAFFAHVCEKFRQNFALVSGLWRVTLMLSRLDAIRHKLGELFAKTCGGKALKVLFAFRMFQLETGCRFPYCTCVKNGTIRPFWHWRFPIHQHS